MGASGGGFGVVSGRLSKATNGTLVSEIMAMEVEI